MSREEDDRARPGVGHCCSRDGCDSGAAVHHWQIRGGGSAGRVEGHGEGCRCAEGDSLAGICLAAEGALEGTLFGVAADMAAQVLEFGKRALANVAMSLAVDLHVRVTQLRHGVRRMEGPAIVRVPVCVCVSTYVVVGA